MSLANAPRPLIAVMSSGFFGFFAHAGFLAALEEMGVVPDAYAGSSSGALVAAAAAGGQSPLEMLAMFQSLSKEEFWDPPRGTDRVKALLRLGKGRTGYLEGQAMERLLERHLPVRRFEDCPRPCLVVALDLVENRRVVLDKGPLAPAVRASGAVPGMFSAVELNGSWLVDGGLVDKAPLIPAADRLSAGSLVVHLLPSSSLEGHPRRFLSRTFTPLRIQARAVDASRRQVYEDHKDEIGRRDIPLWEVNGAGITRLGPDKLHNGPQAFNQAFVNTKRFLKNA